MLYDCPDCGEAYAAEGFSVTLCPRCDSENVASFERPLNAPKSSRRGAWAAGLSAGLIIMAMAVLSWSTLDLDDDGLSTYREWQEGTKPFDADSDGDGLLDGWEVDNDLDPNNVDSDGDGVSDLQEVREAAKLDPALCESLPLVLGPCDAPQQPDSTEALAANASATRVTAWFAVASVAAAAAVGLVVARNMGRR